MQIPTRENSRGISPLVGAVLLIGIAVLLVASIGVIAMSAGEKVGTTPSFHAASGTVEFDVNTTELEAQRLVFTHRGGESVPLDEVDVLLETGDSQIRMPLTEAGAVSGEAWKSGERLTLPVNTTELCSGSNSIEIAFVQSIGGRSYVLGESTIPVVPPWFAIEGGSVVPKTEYTADITVVGTALTYGEYGPDIDITTEIVVGNESHTPWSGNINDGHNPRSRTFTDQPADAKIAVRATGDPDGEYITPRTRRSTDTESGWVYVLRDGDDSPTIRGYGDQDNVSDYLSPYLTENGTITLADNEAIFLFELGNRRDGAAADYQDLVVLATIEPSESRTGETTRTNGATGIVCPAS